MVGVALCLGTVMQSGGGAFGVAGITKGGCGVWLQLVDDDAAPVPGTWALFGCASVGDCAGGCGWLGCKMMGVGLRGAGLGFFFALAAVLRVGMPQGGVCEYTTCSDRGALKGADNG